MKLCDKIVTIHTLANPVAQSEVRLWRGYE